MSPPGNLSNSVADVTDSLDARSGTNSTEPTKPCRACTDFKTWAKIQAQNSKPKTVSIAGNDIKNLSTTASLSSASSSTTDRRTDCPVDKDELGRATWTFLHTMAAYYPERPTSSEKNQMKNFITIFSRFYPCESCAEHFRKEISQSPPEVESQEKLSQWFCRIHNLVNERIHKPKFDCSKVNQRWKDGWLDGSCD